MADRPGAQLAPADLDATKAELDEKTDSDATRRDVLAYLLYPKVYLNLADHRRRYGDTSQLATPFYFYGLRPLEELAVDIEPGKTLIIKLVAVSEPHSDGTRTVFFELNGQPRDVTVVDHSLEQKGPVRIVGDPSDPTHVIASMPGMVSNVSVEVGDSVAKGQKLLMLEAMKMQTTIQAEYQGTVKRVIVSPGDQVEAGDLLMEVE